MSVSEVCTSSTCKAISESVNVCEVFFFTCVRDWLLGCAIAFVNVRVGVLSVRDFIRLLMGCDEYCIH